MGYYSRKFGVSSSLITYGMRESKSQGREWLDRFGLASRQYVLFVGRLVPENNIHHLIKAFERTKTNKRLVIVGGDPWEKEYVRSLKSTSDARVVFTGGIYGEGYEQLPGMRICSSCPTKSGALTRRWSRRWVLGIVLS